MNVSVLPPFVPARTCFIVRNGKTDHLRIGRENQTETGLIVPMLNWLSLISSTSFNRRSQLTTCFRTAGWWSIPKPKFESGPPRIAQGSIINLIAILATTTRMDSEWCRRLELPSLSHG